MLTQLRIQNFAIVDQLDVNFHTGLQVVTGETGAGKSILVDALELVLGGRAQPDAIRSGAEEAVVEALFHGPGLDARLERLGLPPSEGELVVRRVVSRHGRGKVTINGALSTVGMLAQLCSGLVDLSGQHEHVALLDGAGHLDLLDGFAGLQADRERYEALYTRWLEAARARSGVATDEAERARRVDYLAYQLREIEALDPKPGEEEHLAAERRRLASAERLLSLGEMSCEAITGSEGACGPLARALSKLVEAQGFDPALATVVVGVRAALAEAEDAGRTLSRYVAGLEAQPDRLAEMDERLDALRRLARKHGVTVEALTVRGQAMRTELEGMQNHEARLAQLEMQVSSTRKEALAAAQVLSKRRTEAAASFARAVRRELGHLALGGTKLELAVTSLGDEPGPHGVDRVELLISTNPGEPLRPLAKVASGGELARVLLSIKRSLAQAYPVDTYVFDEADAGVGGAVAEAVGRMLREVADHRQVFCITHLPQVAAFASHHYVVQKEVIGGRTISSVRELGEGAERQQELARMLAGAEVSPVALEHAAHLMQVGARATSSKNERATNNRGPQRAQARASA